MASQELIDAQFDRAVEIVQSLPKTGPIQTDYEEKLTMYSLYKQATVGNVKSPRPGIWDMLGRAKWDAWAKHRELDSYEAKWLYVEALLKVLRKYSDKTIAMTLVQELESYGGDPSNIIMSRTLSGSASSDSSGSTVSDDNIPPHYQNVPGVSSERENNNIEAPESTSDEDSEDEAREIPVVPIEQTTPQPNRPQSSLSSHRYRTPMTGSLAMSPPPTHNVPATQPLPIFETPSAFAEPSPASSPSYPATSSYVGQLSESSRAGMPTPTHIYPAHPHYRGSQQPLPTSYGPYRPASRPTLERAVENVQVHLAALTERLESLETLTTLSRSHVSLTPRSVGSPGRRGSPNSRGSPQWDLDDLGMWSIVLNPLSRGLDYLRELATFFARNENRSPTTIILRRLCLDVSFLLCVVGVISALWRKSGVRRREVRAALVVLWRAILGTKPERSLVNRGV
ncbi:acyl CoA binding protein-domain-containing protein [Collybia nuda]|uniref:Acyl CoA binding protein-domain-containing protein n=1 Tax=Collybia nuda TaxID=64659 RepID=A0A9P6CQC7_9AGAR|nr:acyl CoA binding protein-domain-containing protein [Collybia nuda]